MKPLHLTFNGVPFQADSILCVLPEFWELFTSAAVVYQPGM